MGTNRSSDHLVAGVSGGFISTLLLHPLDLLKVRFAVSDGRTKPIYAGYFQAARSIVTARGIFGEPVIQFFGIMRYDNLLYFVIKVLSSSDLCDLAN